ncbi:MAG: YkgJ family cysteine cluster protein [Candidatus Poseidoniales archaeon]|nr:MAG: YkgJ family cysteine cluster protein [Candidatus Poseidoniales archaeon]
MKGPWWKGGVRFACQSQCGRCCDEPGGIVYLSPDDARRIADHEGLEVPEWLNRDARTTYDGRYVLKSRESDGVCIHLDENKQCDIYSVRPQQCKAFPWWGENLADKRSWSQTKERCPGIDAEDALLIDGATIRLHVFSDRTSSKGFRSWPPSTGFWNR